MSRVLWHRSFYVRIAGSIVLFTISLLLLQTLLFNRQRQRRPLGERPPNVMVAIVAADLQAELARDPQSAPDAYLRREFGQAQPIYMVRRNGTVAANRDEPLAADLRRYAESLLSSSGSTPVQPDVPIPFVTAPVQVNGVLDGVVLLPPKDPVRFALERNFEDRLASPGGTLLFVVLTIIAAGFIFEPARRRLRDLQVVSDRLGSGDLAARAAISGADEVSAVAASFNRMADELARRDEALRASDRLRRQMLADVSHELKTPLTSMRGYLETLRDPTLAIDADTRERYFTIVERETRRLEQLVRDLLDLARLENGVTALEPRVFATVRLFEHVRNRHLPELERRHIQVTLTVARDADQIVGDPDRLEQVVENLFANALRHSPDGGRIALDAEVGDTQVRLTVRDSGPGITPAHLPHVFDRFYKVDPARQAVSDGSGLGLSIARAIVERHGGTLTVTSAPGDTAFTIGLPYSPEPAVTPSR